MFRVSVMMSKQSRFGVRESVITALYWLHFTVETCRFFGIIIMYNWNNSNNDFQKIFVVFLALVLVGNHAACVADHILRLC